MTMVELIIVMGLIAFFSLAAISTYTNATGKFRFISSQKKVLSLVKNARSNAITNKIISGNTVPNAYGLHFTVSPNSPNIYTIQFFADSGPTDFRFESAFDEIIEEFVLGDDYAFNILDSTLPPGLGNALRTPLTIFYETGSGNFSIFEDDVVRPQLVSKSEHKFVAIRLCDEDCPSATLDRFILLFQISGLPETYDDVDDFI